MASQQRYVSRRYVSRELTHFAAAALLPDENAQYQALVRILSDGWLKYSPEQRDSSVGISLTIRHDPKLSSNEKYVPQCVCFCDIPVADLGIHMRKYGRFALSFRKSFLVPVGARPVYYIPTGAVTHTLSARLHCAEDPYGDREGVLPSARLADFFDVMAAASANMGLDFRRRLQDVFGADGEGAPPEELKAWRSFVWDLWELLGHHVFAFAKFFDHERDDTDDRNYYMEREWRLLGDLRFALNDVYRVIIPRKYAAELRSALPQYLGQISFADEYLGPPCEVKSTPSV